MISTTIVCGPPGAGKSTYVKKIKGINDIVIDVDSLFRALTLMPGRQKPDSLLSFVLEVREAIFTLLTREFKGPSRAWVIMCGENNELRSILVKRLRANVVVLPVPVGVCKARMVAQGRPPTHVSQMVDLAVRWHQKFRRQAGEELLSECLPQYGADGSPVLGTVAD